MEKKSIGRFIAALRKANGMTQKELAEQLNVSDKAVSRWERDESAPDLSLIPVIAEIFHVTSDEILRGERVNHQDMVSEKSSEKGKKQMAMLLSKSKARFQMHSLIAIGIAGAGLLGAMICNMGFNRAYVGFFAACIFYLAAVIYEGIWFLQIIPSIDMEEAEKKELRISKNHMVKWFFGTTTTIVSMFVFTLPLFIVVHDAYVGLTFGSWLTAGLPGAGIVAMVGSVLWWWLSVKKYTISEDEIERNHLKLKYARRTALIMFVTFLTQILCYDFINVYHPFAKGTTFYSYEEFVAFMEQDISDESAEGGDMMSHNIIGDTVYYDEYAEEILEETYYDDEGNEISKEEYEKMHYTCEIYDNEGNLACTYIHRNESVAGMQYGHIHYEEGEDMPITVRTWAEVRYEDLIWDDLILPIFLLLYMVEIVAGIFFYNQNKKVA